MLMTVLDGNGNSQKIIIQGQESIVGANDAIVATGTAQDALAANTLRSGYLIQNVSNAVMYVNDLGDATSSDFQIPAGGFFPPVNYAVNTNRISVTGTQGSEFVKREW